MKYTRRLFSLVLAVLFGIMFVNAGTNDTYTQIIQPSNGAEVVFEPSLGRFKITFVYYYNPTNSAKDVSLRGGSYIQAKIDGYKDVNVMSLSGCSDCERVDYSDVCASDSDGYVAIDENGETFVTSGRFSQDVRDGTAAKATFYYYPPKNALGKKVSFYFNFKIEQDQDGEGNYWRDATKEGATLPNIESGDFSASHTWGTLGNIDLSVTYQKGSIPPNLKWNNTNFQSSTVVKSIALSPNNNNYNVAINLVFSKKVTKTINFTHKIEGLQKIKDFKAVPVLIPNSVLIVVKNPKTRSLTIQLMS